MINDYYAWAQQQAQFLQHKQFDMLDINNLAEEIADLGRSEKRALESYIEVLLLHLLKWIYQPAKRCNSWKSSISGTQSRIKRLLKQNPSMKNLMDELIVECYEFAKDGASSETGLSIEMFPEIPPFDAENIFEPVA